MKKNMGSVDKIIRIAVAVLFATLYFTGIVSGTLGILMLVMAGVSLLTSLVCFCPLYYLINLSTIKEKKAE